MSSRKCYVCACFNVKETVVLADGSLCSSCRRNLSRWREKRPTNGKYFKTPNSRRKPGLKKAPIARKNRKLALLTRKLSEISPLFQLPEDVFFGGCCLSGRFRYLKIMTNMQPRKPNLHVKLSLESISET